LYAARVAAARDWAIVQCDLIHDGWLLFLKRFTRLFAYGALSVILVQYLTSLGLTEPQTGTILTLTLVADAAVSLFLTTRADRIGMIDPGI
jgi:hypothetical protein